MQVSRPPFTRITVVDLPSAAFAVSDIYDKLDSVALSINQGQSPSSSAQGTAPASPSPDPSVRVITASSPLSPSDTTVLALIQADTSVILPDTRGYPSRPQWIKNSSASMAGADLSLQSPMGQKVDDAAAGNVVLAPGKAACIQAIDPGWVILSRIP